MRSEVGCCRNYNSNASSLFTHSSRFSRSTTSSRILPSIPSHSLNQKRTRQNPIFIPPLSVLLPDTLSKSPVRLHITETIELRLYSLREVRVLDDRIHRCFRREFRTTPHHQHLDEGEEGRKVYVLKVRSISWILHRRLERRFNILQHQLSEIDMPREERVSFDLGSSVRA